AKEGVRQIRERLAGSKPFSVPWMALRNHAVLQIRNPYTSIATRDAELSGRLNRHYLRCLCRVQDSFPDSPFPRRKRIRAPSKQTLQLLLDERPCESAVDRKSVV